MQADVHRWDDQANDWSQDRWATGDRAIFGKGKLWQQHLSLTAPRDSARGAALAKDKRLPQGKYLVKLYVDRECKLAKDFPAVLGVEDFVGQIEVTSAWP